MFYQNWYDNLDEEKKHRADLIIEKVKKIDQYAGANDKFGTAYAEIKRKFSSLSRIQICPFSQKESL